MEKRINEKMKQVILTFLVIVSVICMIWFSPKYADNHRMKTPFQQEFVQGKVIRITEENLMADPVIEGKFRGGQSLEVEILQGKDSGKIYPVYNALSALHNTRAYPGLKAVFTIRETEGKKVVWLYNEKRDTYLYMLGAVFVGLILLLGKMKGAKSLLSLIFTGTSIVCVLLPYLFSGAEPISGTILMASVVTLVSFLLIGGFEKKTYSAIMGTVFGITLAGGISYFFGKLMNLSGINMEGGQQLLYIAKDYKLRIEGLLFASILISSLGAVMDVAMSIASSVNELHEQNPEQSLGRLFASALNIGRDIMGTMINTLILAFAGSSLPLMMMIWGYNMKYDQFINIPGIAIEIMNALAGSIGIIATLPATALISILFIKKEREKLND